MGRGINAPSTMLFGLVSYLELVAKTGFLNATLVPDEFLTIT
jgi:hypothetical protein